MIRVRFLFPAIFWLALRGLGAQTPAYLHYTIRDGLPGNLVYCGLQDHRGLLWFGTDKGLACFDGMRFRTYGVAEGLPDPEVLELHEDSRGRLWLFCFRKKPCYMLDGRIVTEKEDSLLAKINFSSGAHVVSEMPGGVGLWFSDFTEKAYFWDGHTLTQKIFPKVLANFQAVGDDFLTFGIADIMRTLPDGQIEYVFEVDSSKQAYHSVSISGNRILYTYADVVILLEWENKKIKRMARQEGLFGHSYCDRQGRFWICSGASGVTVYDNRQRDLSNPIRFLPEIRTNNIFEDAQGTFWFCTATDGIYALQKNTPLIIGNQSGERPMNVRSIARNAVGDLWVGDDNGNIYTLHGNSFQPEFKIDTVNGLNWVRQIVPMKGSSCWVASDRGVAYILENKMKSYFRGSTKGIYILHDTLWAATATLLAYFVNGQRHAVKMSRHTTVAADSEGIIWAGTVEGMVSRKDSFQFNWAEHFPALKSRIIAIQNAGAGKLWVVTPEKGLLSVRVKAGRVTGVDVVNERLKNPIRNIQALYVEPNGNVWLATNRGVYGLRSDGNVVHYTASDGLVEDDVNTVFVHRDTLWAGTVSGLTRILLDVSNEAGEFATYIANLRYQDNNQKTVIHLLDSLHSRRREIVVSPRVTNIELDLTGLDYRSRRNLRFEIVRTELLLPLQWWTFDNLGSWVAGKFQGNTDTIWEESATFGLGAYLPPGVYRFQVTAVKATGLRSLYPDTWTLVKKPHWYDVVWLYLALWCAAAYGIWRIYKARAAYREVNAAAARLQLQALQSQMNPHFIGNSVNAIQQFLHPPDPEKASEYIALFTRLLRRTMFFSEKTFIPFADEQSYIEEYLRLVHLRFEDRFQYEIIGADTVPPDTPIPTMLLQPILENATLHGIAPDGVSHLRLEFHFSPTHFETILSDNGIGFAETQRRKKLSGTPLHSKGLNMLEKKIETLNRLYNLDFSLRVQDVSESDPGQRGTRVTLTYSPDKVWKTITKLPATEQTPE